MRKFYSLLMAVVLMAVGSLGAWAVEDEVVANYTFGSDTDPVITIAGSRTTADYSYDSPIAEGKFLNLWTANAGAANEASFTIVSGDVTSNGQWTLEYDWAVYDGCNKSQGSSRLYGPENEVVFNITNPADWNSSASVTLSDGTVVSVPIYGCDSGTRGSAKTAEKLTAEYWKHVTVVGTANGVYLTIQSYSADGSLAGDIVLNAGKVYNSNVNPTKLGLTPGRMGSVAIQNLTLAVGDLKVVSYDYTVKFVDQNGVEFKNAEVRNAVAGTALAATADDKATITDGNTQYTYVSDDAADRTVDGEGVVFTITYQKTSVSNYAVNYLDANGNVLKEATVHRNVETGTEVQATAGEMSMILVDGVFYQYQSGNDAITVAEDESQNVINLVFAPIEGVTGYFLQNYENGGTDWTTATGGRFTPVIIDGSTIASREQKLTHTELQPKIDPETGAPMIDETGEQILEEVVIEDGTETIEFANKSKFLAVNQAERNNNGVTNGVSSGSFAIDEANFTLEANIILGTSNNQGCSFQVKNLAGDANILQLIPTAVGSTTWVVNGDAENYAVELPGSGNYNGTTNDNLNNYSWYNLKVTVYNGVTFVTILDEAGTAILEQAQVPTLATTYGLSKMIFYTGRYNSNFAIDDILVRSVNVAEDVPADAQFVAVKINYVDADGNAVKASETANFQVGQPVELNSAFIADFKVDADGNIWTAESESTPVTKYIYTQNYDNTTLAEADLEINLQYRGVGSRTVRLRPQYQTVSGEMKTKDAAGKNLSVFYNSSDTGDILFEGDVLTFYYPYYLLVDGLLYKTAANGSGTDKGELVIEAGTGTQIKSPITWTPAMETVEVKDPETDEIITTEEVQISNAVFASETENIPGITVVNDTYTQIRMANGAAGSAIGSDVLVTTLEPGKYTLTTATRSGTTNFTALGTVVATISSSGAINTVTSDEFTINQTTPLYIKQQSSNTQYSDYVLIRKTADIAAFALTTTEGIANGTVEIPAQAAEGAVVTPVVTPADGYKLAELTVTTTFGSVVTVANGSFTMPAEAVIVSATFEQVPVEIAVSDAIADGTYFCTTFSSDKALDFTGMEGITAYVGKKATNSYGELTTLKLTAVEKVPANTGLIIVASEATTYTVPLAEGDVEPVDNDLVVATEDIDLFSAITTEQYGGFVSGPALLGKAQVMDYDADYQIIYKDIIGFTPATKPQAEGTEFVTAGTVYLPLDATTETAYGYFQDGFAVKLQIAAQAVEVANIAELKQSGAEAAILTLNNTKISYISAATAQAVFEDESGAILLQGPAELAAFATYGITSLSGTIGLEMTNGVYSITDINGIQPAGSDPVEPTVITADNAADYLANYDWKYVKFEGVQYSAANKSITIDALGQEIAVQDILTTGITFPEEDATLNVVGFINDLDLSAYGAGVITSFQPVSIEEASEPLPEIALDGYIYQIKSENLFANGSFDDGVAGWKTIGYTTDAVASNFTLTAEGGFDGGAYITTNGAGVGSANTIRQSVAVEPGKQYYFTVYTSGKAPDSQNFNYNALFQMTDAVTENGVLKAFEWPQGAAQTATEWSQTEFVFTAAEGNPFVGVRMGWNSASSFDGFALYEVELIGTDPVPFIAKYEAAVEAARAAIADEANAAATEEIAALQALIPAERPAEVEAMEAAREAIVAATAALIAAPTAIQYNAIMTAYPQDAATLIPEFEAWEGGMVSNKGQHWDGTTTSTYFEQTGAQWGQDAWTNSKTTTLTLPAGSYVIMAAGRSSASENVKAYIKVNDTEIIYPANGDRGLGVDINGVGTKAADATYANNGAGRGWEYRYVEFESDGETPVTLTIGGEATAKNQWMSFTKPLLRTTEENTAIADRILAAAKEAALAELAALPTDCVFGYDKMNIMSAQWDIEDATTPEAVQEILLGVYDTQLLPEEGVAYTIKNVSAGQQLAISTEKVSIEEKASVFFTPVEGGYVLSNEAGEYIFKVGTDKWTLSTTSDIDQAYVLTFNIVEGGYTIQGANGLFGTDNATAGSAVYANKALANNGLWSITEYGEIEIANLQFTAAEAFEEDGTLKIYATYDATAEGIYKENPGKLATEIYVDVYEEGVEEPVQTNIPLAFGAGDITDGQAYAYVSNLDQEKNYTFVLKQFTVGLGDYQFDEETFDVTFVFTDKFFELAEPIYYPALPEIAVYEGTIQQSLVMLQTGMIMGTTTGEQTVTVTPVEEGLVNITFSGFQMPVLPNAIPEFTIENVAVTTDEEGTITYTAEPFTVAVPMGQMTSNNAGTLTGTMTKGAAVPTLVLTLQNATRDIVVFGDDMDAIQAITDQLTGEIATAITGVAPAAQKADGKYLENGKIVIVKGGKTYSTTGVELK